MRRSLHRTMLHYDGDLVLHTASSGRIDGLDTLYLRLRDADGIEAAGEVRINIGYLNGYAAEEIVADAMRVLPNLIIGSDALAPVIAPPPELARATAPVRMLIDLALHDLAAKRRGLPLARLLTGAAIGDIAYPSNQTLFLSDDATFLQRAQAYIARGFRDLKVRIGASDFARDVARLQLLRERFGSQIKLAADANGAWSLAEAPACLDALAAFDLAYIEQPVAPTGFEALARLAENSPIPIMLDESVASEDDIARLSAGGHRLMAHLKLVKLGGIAPTLRAARMLGAAEVPFMIGQMNEGGLATAAALHVCVAVETRFAELYGADGLIDDAAPGLVYADGTVSMATTAGLGPRFAHERTTTLWED